MKNKIKSLLNELADAGHKTYFGATIGNPSYGLNWGRNPLFIEVVADLRDDGIVTQYAPIEGLEVFIISLDMFQQQLSSGEMLMAEMIFSPDFVAADHIQDLAAFLPGTIELYTNAFLSKFLQKTSVTVEAGAAGLINKAQAYNLALFAERLLSTQSAAIAFLTTSPTIQEISFKDTAAFFRYLNDLSTRMTKHIPRPQSLKDLAKIQLTTLLKLFKGGLRCQLSIL